MQIKNLKFIFVAGLIATVSLWFISATSPASSSYPLAITSTPGASIPTALPTEELTPVPTVQPSVTTAPTSQPTLAPSPTFMPTPTKQAATDSHEVQPTLLPPLGDGEPAPVKPLAPSPVTRLSIPVFGLTFPVQRVHYSGPAWDITGLGLRVGWLDNSSIPEQGGNTILVGHVNMRGDQIGPFKEIDQLLPGAALIVRTPYFVFHYMVDEVKVVNAGDLSVLTATDAPTLTLLTCDEQSWDWNALAYVKRLVVVAHLASFEENK